MKTPASTVSRFAAAGALVALLSSSLPRAAAADLTWATAAAGTWNTTTTTAWNPGPVAWDNANNDTAIFGGTTATYIVSIAAGTAISAGGLSVTAGNTITLNGGSGYSLILAGPAPKIAVDGVQLNLNTVIQGTAGFEKTGTGILRIGIGAGGTYTGVTKISAGQVTNDINNGLSANASLSMAGSSFLSLVGKNQSVAGLSGTSGTTVRSTATTSNFTVTAGSGTFAGTLSDGTAAVRLNFINAGGSLTLSGSNNYRGTTEISGGTLTLASSLFNSANSTGTSSVTVSGGSLASSVASVKLGVGDFSMTSGALSANDASIGTYTLAAGKNFLASGGTINFTLGLGGTSDAIIGSGAGIFSFTGSTILALAGNTSVAGTYTLFSGFTSGSVSGVTITGLGNGFTGSLGDNGVLTVSAAAIPEPSTYAVLAGAVVLGLAARRRSRV